MQNGIIRDPGPIPRPKRRFDLKYPPVLFLCLAFVHCGKVGKLGEGTYEVADREYSSQNYGMSRVFESGGDFREKHVVDHCLLMEMRGKWSQKNGSLHLDYAAIRNRAACRDSLPEWAADSAALEIPIRNVDGTSFESFLTASDGKPEKWIKWLKTE